MRGVFVGLVVAFPSLLTNASVKAESFALAGTARWVVLASRPDRDEAIGVARYHRWQFPSVRVVRSANGWYAVVFGPEQAANPRALRERLAKGGNIPRDFIFSRGDSYVEQVWTPSATHAVDPVKYDGKRDTTMRVGDLSITMGSAPEKDSTERHPIAVGRQDGRRSFVMSLNRSTRAPDDENSSPFAEMQTVRLDPTSTRSSLVFSSFWGGAHCCTITQIATEDARTGRWTIAEGEPLDGGGGYGIDDIDGDGIPELLSGDQSFLYAFGPYSSSNMPTKVRWLRGGRIEDVTRHASYAGYLRQGLAMMEHAANLEPGQWRDNNFLAGWVAQSILVGRGEQAWARMLQLYDRQSEWLMEACTVNLSLEKCPDDRKRKIDFPTALRRHLAEAGYGAIDDAGRTFGSPSTPGPNAQSPVGPPQYDIAEAMFDRLDVDRRIRLQVLLTATGYQNAVPNVSFSKRLFETLIRYQTQTGQAVTGMVDDAGTAAMLREATPLLRTWGLREAGHPFRGHPIWVPFGLGLREERSATGITWKDPAQRVVLSYVASPGDLEGSYRSALERLASDGARINFKVFKPDFFAISASGADGLDWYVRFHRDGTGVLGFFLAWKTAETDLHIERVATLVSGSLWASMTGAAFTNPPSIEPPPTTVTVARPSPPIVPTPPAVAPKPPEEKPHEASSGTGFFVSRDGHLITNAHVVRDCSAIEVNGPNGLVPARLIAQDKTNDLALLKTPITPLEVATLRSGVRLGEGVAVFGYPLSGMLSTSGNFTLGNVTALTGLGDDSRYFQISAPAQPGNSGGPLVDANGNLIGVVTSKLNALKVMVATNGDIPQNVNFAIKGSVAGTFLESNGVAFTTGSASTALPPADLADHAKAISVYVTCR